MSGIINKLGIVVIGVFKGTSKRGNKYNLLRATHFCQMRNQTQIVVCYSMATAVLFRVMF